MQGITINWHQPYQLDRKHLLEVAYDKGVYAISRVWGE